MGFINGFELSEFVKFRAMLLAILSDNSEPGYVVKIQNHFWQFCELYNTCKHHLFYKICEVAPFLEFPNVLVNKPT